MFLVCLSVCPSDIFDILGWIFFKFGTEVPWVNGGIKFEYGPNRSTLTGIWGSMGGHMLFKCKFFLLRNLIENYERIIFCHQSEGQLLCLRALGAGSHAL